MSERFIGKYEVVNTLGKGSMGVVYKARDPEIGRLVAIKTLKSMVMGNDAAGEEALQRFRQESRSAGMLHHPNVVTIFEAGKTDNGSPYIVMEHIEGESLEQRISNQGALAPLEVLHYLSQVASAIDYAHSQNVIHRDIKPSNIIVGSDFKPYLLDFGVAKLADTSLTPAGTVVGTPSYMSPEQIRGLTLDGRTDIFSLAVVAFELFTGVRPFPGKDFTTVVTNIMHKEPRSFQELEVKLPAQLEEELNLGLSKEREERFGSALAMIHSFSQVFGVLVDGSGLVGGYRPELEEDKNTLELDSLSQQKPTVPVQRPPVADENPPNSPQALDTQIGSASNSNRWVYGLVFLGLLASGGFAALTVLKSSSSSSSDQVAVDIPGAEIGDNIQTTEDDSLGNDVAYVEPQVSQGSDSQVPSASDSTSSSVLTEVSESNDLADPSLADSQQFVPAEPQAGFSGDDVAKLEDNQLIALVRQSNLSARSQRVIAQEFGRRNESKFIDSLLFLLEADDFAVRVATLKALKRGNGLEQADVRIAISKSLEDEEYLVRGFAAKILASTKDPKVYNALKNRLAVEDNAVVKKVLQQAVASAEK